MLLLTSSALKGNCAVIFGVKMCEDVLVAFKRFVLNVEYILLLPYMEAVLLQPKYARSGTDHALHAKPDFCTRLRTVCDIQQCGRRPDQQLLRRSSITRWTEDAHLAKIYN
jgi:hypothetical protein